MYARFKIYCENHEQYKAPIPGYANYKICAENHEQDIILIPVDVMLVPENYKYTRLRYV